MNKPIGTALAGMAAVLIAAPAFAQQSAPPDTLYTSAKCILCHGADGEGNTDMGKASETPSLGAPNILKMSTADLVNSVKNGNGDMPAYGKKLTDDQINELVAYIQTLQKKKP